MEIKKLISLMKVLVLLSGILFLIIYSSLETNDCDTCSFDDNNIDEFMNKYSQKCLTVERGLPNISDYKPHDSYSEYPK